jgi:hypothetical protein
MQRYMALKNRGSQRRHQRRAALPLAFPALTLRVQDLTQPTALRFLPAHPTPESILRPGRTRFLAPWHPRQRCGPWRPATVHRLYALAPSSSGLQAPARLDECESTTRVSDLVAARTTPQLWLDKAIERLAQRADTPLLVPLPRIGTPTAAAMLTAIGAMHADHNGKPWVQRAGRDLRWFARGSRLRKLPNIAHVGSAYLRYWL